MRRRSDKPGFTLLELLLVMMIIAIAAALAAPSFQGFSRGRRMPNTATSLVTTARWCRVKALSDGTTYRLNIDRTARHWVVTKDDGTGVFVDVGENDDLGKAHTLPDGIEFGEMKFEGAGESEETGEFVTFKQNGRTDVVTIYLVSDNGQSIAVACDLPLGTFHIVKVTQ